jgi:hypothetical protein
MSANDSSILESNMRVCSMKTSKIRTRKEIALESCSDEGK